MKALGYFSIKKPEVVHETIEEETVIVNLENGNYYSLRNAGMAIWNLIENGANFAEIYQALSDRYQGTPEEIQKGIHDLLIVLQKEGLLQVTSTGPCLNPSPPLNSEARAVKPFFEYPVLEKFSDMQELLLLDPIHEVDEKGWPHKAEIE